jgi:CRISPR/Cas system-associated exonuclease Cas4 (RecB family)
LIEATTAVAYSNVAESFVSVTDVKHYIYCPRLIYFDRVLHSTPVFGSQQEEGKESHDNYVAKECAKLPKLSKKPASS